MHFDWWTFTFQVVNVLVLVWILAHFLFRPVAAAIAARKEAVGETLRQAEETKARSEQALEALRGQQDAFEKQRYALLEEARNEAEAQKRELLDAARKEAVDLVKEAGREVEIARQSARRQALAEAGTLAVEIARRLMENLPSDARIAGYPARLAEAIAALDARQKATMLADPDSLELVAPRELDAAEAWQGQKAVFGLTGKRLALPVITDGTLIAGLELRGPHGTIHNSLLHDLERIRKAITDEAGA